MMQMIFANAAGPRRKTRKELFLIEMGQVVPWNDLIALIRPHYPIDDHQNHPLIALLRVHLMQNWFGTATRRWRKRCTRPPFCASFPG